MDDKIVRKTEKPQADEAKTPQKAGDTQRIPHVPSRQGNAAEEQATLKQDVQEQDVQEQEPGKDGREQKVQERAARKRAAQERNAQGNPDVPPGETPGKKRHKSRRNRHIVRKLLLVLLVLVLAAGLAGYIIIKPEYERYKTLAYEKLAGMSRDDFSMLPDTEIFDKDGNRIGLINAGHYTYAPISEISINLQNAYIAQEDRRFASHHGVDWIATIRAGLAFLKNGGHITQGGSTITQQVIKNTFLTQEQTFPRKITEILMAPELEKKYTKADIMEFYCNTNYYGNRCYGVQAASQYYFGKDAADLTVPEAATLAGISNSPARYDPVKHPEDSKEKRNRVLGSMYEEGFLSESDYKAYVDAPLVIVQKELEGTKENYQSSYALHCAALTLMKLDQFDFQYVFEDKESYDAYQAAYSSAYNDKIELLRGGGYEIYTSLDSGLQRILQEELDSVLSPFAEQQENGKYALQGAGVIVDNATGYVTAIVGGRGETDELNRAYYSALQPGSTIKPLLDYGPAFDTGEYYPARIVDDHKWTDGPANASGTYAGNVTVRQALNQSLNTVAWQVLEDIGIQYGLSYLGKMEFQKLSYIDGTVPSVSIGGFTNGVRVVDMAKGYAALANNGVYSDRTCITKIVHEKNGELTSGVTEQKTQVYLPDTAWMITDILKGNFTEGTAKGLALANGMPAAGKTGTTNESRQTWFCGYTRYYSTAVWVGYDTPRPMPGVYGATYAGKIWKQVMDRMHDGKPAADWEKPASVEQRTEENGTTDWRSNTDELRAAESLHEKEQAALLAEVQSLLDTYENQTIASMDDTRTVQEQYDKLVDRAALLDDGEEKNEVLSRALAQKEINDRILDSMPDTIKRWEEQESLAAEESRAKAESEAEIARKKAEEDVNRQEVQNAIDALNALEYWPSDAADRVNEAIQKLELISGYPDEASYTEKLNEAIDRLDTLPSEESWKKQEALKESAAAEEEAAEESRTAQNQSYLKNRFEHAKRQREHESQQAGPGFGPGFSGGGSGFYGQSGPGSL